MHALEIKNFKNLNNNVLPVLNDNLFFLEKKKQFNIFKQIINLMYKKQHLKLNKLIIIEKAYEMNKNGINRKLTKQQYIKIITNKYNLNKV
jgi:hypothetical protein